MRLAGHPVSHLGRWTTAACVSMIAALLTNGSAEAAAPARQVTPVSESFSAPVLSGACGFEITGHLEGTITVTDFADQDDTFVREITLFRGTQTFSGNNRSITGQTSQQITTAMRPDGSFTVAFMGIDSLFTLPGSGPVVGSAGRLKLLYAPNGDLLEVSQQVGPVFVEPAEVCAALTA